MSPDQPARELEAAPQVPQDGFMSVTARTKPLLTRVVVGALAAALGGCGGGSTNASPARTAAPSASDDQGATAGLVEHHRFHHHGGVTLLLSMSLDTLGLPPEERAPVEKIRADLRAAMEPARLAEQSLLKTLSAGLGAGTIDAAQVDSGIAQFTAAAAAVDDASANALNQLHAVLTPLERRTLVDKIESHWAVWQKANADERGAVGPEGSHLEQLVAELDLTQDQVAQIRLRMQASPPSVPPLDPNAVAAHLRTFDEAFGRDTFDARGLLPSGTANERMAHWGAARMAHFVEAVAPVLTEAQRTKYAERLRDHASHDPSAQASP